MDRDTCAGHAVSPSARQTPLRQHARALASPLRGVRSRDPAADAATASAPPCAAPLHKRSVGRSRCGRATPPRCRVMCAPAHRHTQRRRQRTKLERVCVCHACQRHNCASPLCTQYARVWGAAPARPRYLRAVASGEMARRRGKEGRVCEAARGAARLARAELSPGTGRARGAAALGSYGHAAVRV